MENKKEADKTVKTDVYISVPTNGNEKLEEVVKRVNSDIELMTHLKACNVMAITRLGYSDHGPVHVKIVANMGLRVLRILISHGVVPNIVKDYSDYGFTDKDAEVIVYLASVLHDIGMIIHREKHDELGIAIAYPILHRVLDGVYDKEKKAIITGEVLHAILMHDKNVRPLTVEAGVLRIADGLDMERGRARIPFEAGKINIHSVSAMAIDKVEIHEGKEKPVEVTIRMSNSAGIFQVDELLKQKIDISGLRQYIKVNVVIDGETERKILENYQLD